MERDTITQLSQSGASRMAQRDLQRLRMGVPGYGGQPCCVNLLLDTRPPDRRFGDCLETVPACQWARCNSQHLNLLGRVIVSLSAIHLRIPLRSAVTVVILRRSRSAFSAF